MAIFIIWLIFRDDSSTLRVNADTLTISEVSAGEFNDYIRVSGQVHPMTTIQVSPRESGIVEEIVIEEGTQVKAGDVIAVCEKSASNTFFKTLKEQDAFVAAPKWLDRDKNTLQGKVVAMPTKADIDFDIAVHLIVELYSK